VSRHRRGSVVGTALSLMTSTVLSAVLTFGFWIAAARFFPAATVGRISAGVASITLLAAVAQLNLHSMYGRFLPGAGAHSGRLVLGGYGASTLTAAALAAGYLLLDLDGDVIGDDRRAQTLFGVGVVATAIFLIQDGVLTGLRRASAVPMKNAVSAAGKLALMPALAGGAGGDGLLLAWVLPVVAVMLTWNGWILVRLVPAHVGAGRSTGSLTVREVLRFASAEYVNGIVNNVVAFLPPLLVTHVAGPERGAYLYLPWVIGVSVTTMLWQTVTSFVAEASTAEARGDRTLLAGHLKRTAALVAAVAGGGGLFLAVAAEPLLWVLGTGYAAQGATPLRLIGLSLPFTGLVVLYAGFAAMEKRMWRMVALQSTAAVAFLAAAWFNLPHHGLAAPAAALLLAQAALGLAVLPGLVTRIRAAGSAAAPPAPPPVVPVPRPSTTRIADTPRRTGSRHPRPAGPRAEALMSSRRSTW
jgi:O-antigen/teichoic acid export membrane protein